MNTANEVCRQMKKLKDVYLLHFCLAWATREELLQKTEDLPVSRSQ